jgi:pimeloyl-ACP methyl ester carboxylesterase
MGMTRREALLAFSSAGVAASLGLSGCAKDRSLSANASGRVKTSLGVELYYEVHGNPSGPNLFLTVPLSATPHWLVRGLKGEYLSHFTDRYKVLLADYPYSGKSDKIPDYKQLTVEQVCSDYLALADAAGMDRFGIAGYSWGGVSSLQLATRSDRVSALAVGGWPALGGPYADLLALSQKFVRWWISSATQWVTYYQGLQSWPEHEEVAKLKMPRLNYVDSTDDGSGNLFAHFSENRAELERLGWQTAVIESGSGHRGGMRPENAGPLLRKFFDSALG